MNEKTKTSHNLNPLKNFFTNGWNLPTSQKNNEDNPSSDEGHLIVDMYERENSYYIVAPTAGVGSDDIEIELNDDQITIKGQRSKEPESPDRKYHIQECYWGQFSRHITFPTPVDSEKAAATFKDGMLTICIPKAKSAQTKTLKIKTL
ncbi:Hsp20/alpha crystallin family protein [Patescibacteria group bacterium]|nr:Hsp20/alpha crystallin family protein [Patescibacteria group bacterium]